MAPPADPAIIEALGLESATTTMSPHGGSRFSSTFQISATRAGRPVKYFVKTATGKDAKTMLAGEHASLIAIRSSVALFCPASYAHGAMVSRKNTFFLATDFVDFSHSSSSSSSSSDLCLAAKLARLHTTPAPVPPGFDRPMFGFPVPTCCGSSVQNNAWTSSWAHFYANNRLRHILFCGLGHHGGDDELRKAVEQVADTVVPRLLGDKHLKGVVPVVVHGDLWNGNHGRGRIGEDGGAEEVVFDPSCCYGHGEYELGIMRMFGGFSSGFWKEYEKLVPKAEPVEEWEDRVSLYELYHHLNHWALFGGDYRSGAMSIVNTLIAKYGPDAIKSACIF